MSQPKSRLGKAMAEKGKLISAEINAPSRPWTGPNGEGPNGGVTQGLLGRFMVCPKRFSVRVIEGLGAKEKFEPNIEYGNLWHAGEEAYKTDPDKPNKWLSGILDYYTKLCHKYPMDREAITHWYGLCREQFPIYIAYWEQEGAEKNRVRLLSEQNFDVPYRLPSGKTVRLRGKWDGVCLVDDEYTNRNVPKKIRDGITTKGIWLDENKTKSQIDHVKITKQLKFDMQTMFYITALQDCQHHLMEQNVASVGAPKGMKPESESIGINNWDHPIKGVRYNVVRRSAHKSTASMLKKIHEDINDNRGGEWFGRWNVEVSEDDIHAFKRMFLHPTLERLCLWWEFQQKEDTLIHVNAFHLRDIMTWMQPYGIYNPLDRGGEDAVDEYLRTGSRVGLQRITNLFPELQSAA